MCPYNISKLDWNLLYLIILHEMRGYDLVLLRTWRGVQAIQDRTSPMSYFSDYPYPVQKSGSTLHRARTRSLKSTSYSFPTQGVNKTPEVLSEPGAYYSTFHKTPERKRFSKEEWEQFTKENTREASMDLVSSPDFNKWAMDNAERITLTPSNANIRQRKQRRFLWFYAS
ncbi:uncharacterized protein LOC109820534 isoform X1 [Asparagus officinalis]|uniref:uncharacterized protein LOC109820534 isoform X1 n=1 Tax=Asparagus officinalis TaxID=4686 RepID=UPI00098E5C99|nr:uncharacterized protein LOC109820534 isoform X1 [Asparagus officinalis]